MHSMSVMHLLRHPHYHRFRPVTENYSGCWSHLHHRLHHRRKSRSDQ
jgi:hypothetical protein